MRRLTAPKIWWRSQPDWRAHLLMPAAALVGVVAARRLRQPPSERLGVPVVCVGNPTVGGAGKTPVAIAIAAALRDRGQRPVFLTRGYGGRLAGPVLVGGHSARDVGDEPQLLARHGPVVVARDRAAGGRLAAQHGTVVIMDDGFQNPALTKTVALLVVDAHVTVGNGCVTPAGPLRAPLAAQWPHADAVVLVESGEPPRAFRAPCPTFRVATAIEPPEPLRGQRLIAFAGIGRPQKFFRALQTAGATLLETHAFADHAALSEADAARLLERAGNLDARLATTAKDHVRLGDGPNARCLAQQAMAVDVRAILPDDLLTFIAEGLDLARPNEGG